MIGEGPYKYPDGKGRVPTGARGIVWLAPRDHGPICVVQLCDIRRCLPGRAKGGLPWFWFTIFKTEKAAQEILEHELWMYGSMLYKNGRKPR